MSEQKEPNDQTPAGAASELSVELGRLVKDQMNLYFGSPMPDDIYHEFHSTVGDVHQLCLHCAAAEREACAKMVDHILKEGGGTYGDAMRKRSNV